MEYNMDIVNFEELVSEMLEITDKEREDPQVVQDRFFDEFEIDYHCAYTFVQHLIMHTPIVDAGLPNKGFHAFVSRKAPMMLMKTEAK